MVTLHAFLALLAGYATMSAIVVVATALIARLTPSWVGDPLHPAASYLFVNLGYSFLAAVAAGYVTGWLGRTSPLAHTMVLAVIVLLMAAMNAIFARAKRLIGYQIGLVIVSTLGVLVGGLVRLRVLGLL